MHTLVLHQKDSFNTHTPIILISANSSDLSKEHLEEAGVEVCLQKPIEEKHLLAELLYFINNSKIAPIDWSSCVKKVSGNQALATEFLKGFIEELTKNREEFLQLMQAGKIPELERLAHKLHGACCFCGVPYLQKDVAQLEQVAKYATHIDELQSIFTDLIKSIDAVLKDYQRSYIKKTTIE